MDHDLFEDVRRAWARYVAEEAAAMEFARIAAAESAVAASGTESLGALVTSLDRRSVVRCDAPWEVLTALVRQTAVNPALALGVLVAIIPTMARIAAFLSWGQGGPWKDADEFCGELVATTWDVIAGVAGETLPYPVHAIRRRVYGRLDRQRRKAARTRGREISTSFDQAEGSRHRVGQTIGIEECGLLADECPVPVLDALAAALCSIDEKVLDRRLVRLVYARRVLGYAVREVAELVGQSENVVEYQAARAEALLYAS